jgi:hypothetical protein
MAKSLAITSNSTAWARWARPTPTFQFLKPASRFVTAVVVVDSGWGLMKQG